jgi:hypothetical protein
VLRREHSRTALGHYLPGFVPQFTDPKLGVFTSTRVRDGLPVLLVFHDGDGDWQFLSSVEESADEGLHIHVSHLLDNDETLGQLADLPLGWKAWRWSPDELGSESALSLPLPPER